MTVTIAPPNSDKKEFESRIPTLADRAYEDQCTGANPKQPKVSDLERLLKIAFDGVERK